MTDDEFYDTTLRRFFNRLQGWNELEEQRERSNWERSRMLATTVVNLMAKDPKKPGDIWRLPWDKERKADGPLSADEQKKRFEQWDKEMQQKWQGRT